MRILITGASGFVGRNLKHLFEQEGVEIRTLSLREAGWQLDDTCDALVHLAGIEKDSGTVDSEEEYFKVNAYLTEEVFKAFLTSDIRDFIFISSIKAVVDSSDHIVTEQTPAKPVTPYGKSKLLAEELLSKISLPAGKRLFILRPCLIHGPGETGNLKTLYKIAEKGIPYPFASMENRRSYLGIDNLRSLIQQLIQNPYLSSSTFNVSDDEPISTASLVDLMYKTLHKSPRSLNISAGLIKSITKVFSAVGFGLVEEKIGKLTSNLEVSNAKIKSALGIHKLPLSAEEGLIKTIKSFKK